MDIISGKYSDPEPIYDKTVPGYTYSDQDRQFLDTWTPQDEIIDRFRSSNNSFYSENVLPFKFGKDGFIRTLI
jgi:hypothetical protein